MRRSCFWEKIRREIWLPLGQKLDFLPYKLCLPRDYSSPPFRENILPQNSILLCINDLKNTIYYRPTISKMTGKYEHERIVNLKQQASQNLGMRVYWKFYTTFHHFFICIFYLKHTILILVLKFEKWTQNRAMRLGRVNMNQPNTVMRVVWIWTKICGKLTYFLAESNVNLGQNICIKNCL